MTGRDDIQIRFVKPNDSADEDELEGSSNLLLVPSPRATENASPVPPSTPSTTITTTPTTTTATTPSDPSSARPRESRLRLAVSEFSMKLAQRIEDKYNNTDASVEKPSAKVDRLKRLALDVSKNVKTWSLEQQKLALEGAQAKQDSDPRGRSSSLSAKPTAATTTTEDKDGNSLAIGDDSNGSSNDATTVDNGHHNEAVEESVEALRMEDSPSVTPPEPTSMRIPSSNRLKSISFNENLAQMCSSRPIPSSNSAILSTSDENGGKNSQLPVLSEQGEGENVLGSLPSGNLTSSEPPPSATNTLPSTSQTNSFDTESDKLLPDDMQQISVSFLSDVQSCFWKVSQNKFFPAMVLTLSVIVLRFLYVPDMLIGCVVGTFVTWFLFVFTLPPNPRPKVKYASGVQHATHQSNNQGKLPTVALMNLAYSYNPCTFRLRYSYQCVVSLQGTLLKINILDRKAMKEVKTKIATDPKPPSAEQLEALSFNENHMFDLSTCSVSLRPSSLARKRYFNKKYPILITRHHNDSPYDRNTEVVTQEFYLFTWSMREKETWFTLLSSATHGISLKPFDLIPVRRIAPEQQKPENPLPKKEAIRLSKLRNSVSTGNIGFEAEQAPTVVDNTTPTTAKTSTKKQEDPFMWHYVSRREQLRWFLSQATVLSPSSPIAWFNAFAWRVFFEMMSVEELKNHFHKKLQGKLGKIILPSIIEPLKLSEFNVGYNMPLFKSSEQPFVDDRGLWLTFMVEYDGGLTGLIETRINLLKVKTLNNPDPNVATTASPVPGGNMSKTPDLRYLDILASESCESLSESSESDDDPIDPASLPVSAGASHGNLVERVTSSKYFSKLISLNSVGKYAERVSLVPLTLRVELTRLAGRLRINFPPCPSDRFWIGFEDDDNFAIDVTLQPKFGNVELSGRTLHPIVSYLERKIVSEFKNKFLLPAMDDFYFGFFRDSLLKSDKDPESSESTPPQGSS